eukprot:Lankesteria_metandrocarpae@DN2592_c0_g1_i1.p1
MATDTYAHQSRKSSNSSGFDPNVVSVDLTHTQQQAEAPDDTHYTAPLNDTTTHHIADRDATLSGAGSLSHAGTSAIGRQWKSRSSSVHSRRTGEVPVGFAVAPRDAPLLVGGSTLQMDSVFDRRNRSPSTCSGGGVSCSPVVVKLLASIHENATNDLPELLRYVKSETFENRRRADSLLSRVSNLRIRDKDQMKEIVVLETQLNRFVREAETNAARIRNLELQNMTLLGSLQLVQTGAPSVDKSHYMNHSFTPSVPLLNLEAALKSYPVTTRLSACELLSSGVDAAAETLRDCMSTNRTAASLLLDGTEEDKHGPERRLKNQAEAKFMLESLIVGVEKTLDLIEELRDQTNNGLRELKCRSAVVRGDSSETHPFINAKSIELCLTAESSVEEYARQVGERVACSGSWRDTLHSELSRLIYACVSVTTDLNKAELSITRLSMSAAELESACYEKQKQHATRQSNISPPCSRGSHRSTQPLGAVVGSTCLWKESDMPSARYRRELWKSYEAGLHKSAPPRSGADRRNTATTTPDDVYRPIPKCDLHWMADRIVRVMSDESTTHLIEAQMMNEEDSNLHGELSQLAKPTLQLLVDAIHERRNSRSRRPRRVTRLSPPSADFFVLPVLEDTEGDAGSESQWPMSQSSSGIEGVEERSYRRAMAAGGAALLRRFYPSVGTAQDAGDGGAATVGDTRSVGATFEGVRTESGTSMDSDSKSSGGFKAMEFAKSWFVPTVKTDLTERTTTSPTAAASPTAAPASPTAASASPTAASASPTAATSPKA